MILLSVIDHQWNDHVDSMNRLREGIYLRSYAQIKPEDAYRQEGFERFTNMMANITDQAVLTLLHIRSASRSRRSIRKLNSRNHFKKKRERPVFHLEIPIRSLLRGLELKLTITLRLLTQAVIPASPRKPGLRGNKSAGSCRPRRFS